MYVLVSGSRDFPSEAMVREKIREHLRPGDTLIHGCARGVDRWAASEARRIGCTVLDRPAQWEKYGRSAGFRRNEEMLAEFLSFSFAGEKLALVFWDGRSPGTRHMIQKLKDAHIPHRLYIPH